MTHPRRTIAVRLAHVLDVTRLARVIGSTRAARELCRRRAEPLPRVLARRSGAPAAVSRFMDYGPDWPPAPSPTASSTPDPPRHLLLRRCAAVVVVYVVIWALGSVLLELRLHQLQAVSGHAVTTYTTIDH